jgi:hypothetical protein
MLLMGETIKLFTDAKFGRKQIRLRRLALHRRQDQRFYQENKSKVLSVLKSVQR